MFKVTIARGLWVLLFMVFVIQSCKKDDTTVPSIPSPVSHERGEIVEISSMGTYTTEDVRQVLDATGEEFDFHLSHSLEAFSVKYYTVDHKGNSILVSGALYVPQRRASLAMMSIMHGTVTARDHVASVSPESSTEGIIGLLTASMGYITMVPDYPGFGVSQMPHPYLHAASLVPSVIDFIVATKEYCVENEVIYKDELFLTGYSEGGYLSLMVQKAIEEDYQGEFELTAVAPMAGPYDLEATFDKIFEDDAYSSPAYVAYVLTAYNRVYNWNRLNKFFKAPYAGIMNSLFDGSNSWAQVENALPETLEELMHPDFKDIYCETEGSCVLAAVKENTSLDWRPEAPVHFIHGDCDDIVFCMNANNAMEAFIANGADNILLSILPGQDHETAGPIAVSSAIAWIEDFHPDM